MQGANAVLNVITIPPGATETSARIVLDGVRGAIFVYQSGPVGSSLIGSWAGAAGTDPYGESYPAGFEITVGAIISALIETSATVPSVQLDGTRNALFVYDAFSDLLVSAAGAAGTDFFGHTYPQGIAAFLAGYAFQLAVSGKGFGGFTIADIANPPSTAAQFFSNESDASGCEADLTSGASTNVAVPATVVVQDSVLSGITDGLIKLLAGNISLGVTGNAVWNDNAGSLGLPVGGGPFITGEGFHTISLAAGVTGTLRVKKLPWNGVWMDAQLANTVNGTTNLGSLPDASYYPTTARNLPLAPTVAGATAYIHIPTSGAVQFIASANQNPGGSFMYPTN
jgi:hypothetical protein